MRRLLGCVFVGFIVAWAVTASAAAAPLTAADAVALGKAANGQVIEVQGEAVGEDLSAGDGHRWINVLSGGTAIGVVIKDEQASAIGAYGRYGLNGDTVRVEGVYNVGCDEHGGDLDIHATAIEIVSAGSVQREAPLLWQLGLSVALLVVALLATGRQRRARRAYESG